jgi:16S rRNA (adenine1518-N6/adenine1519-N6)-dimethyltransferase
MMAATVGPVAREYFLRESQHAILRKYGIRPVRRRGQNFLVDGNLARAIAQDTLALGDRVLELGAGGGALTVFLLEGAEKVVCVEVDRHLCGLLQAEFGSLDAFSLIPGDLAKLDWTAAVAAVGPRPVIAGNLPYVLTSTILFALADLRDLVSGAVFMVQKEVARRLTATCGGRDYGILAVVLGSVFEIKVLRKVPPAVFWPRPEVDSAVVRLLPRGGWSPAAFANLTAVVKTLFGQRRKKLRTQLRVHFGLAEAEVQDLAARCGVNPDLRPEHIDTQAFACLAEALARKDRG